MDGRSMHDEIVGQLVERFYQKPLIENVYRSDYMEHLIAQALGEDWSLTPAWKSWDLEHRRTQMRLEVKQSAALQTWTEPPIPKDRPRRPRFDIAPRSGYYRNGGTDWVETLPRRQAHLYVFAWHPENDAAAADHRCPAQWRFYVVPEHRLRRRQKSIGLRTLVRLTKPCGYDELAGDVDAVAVKLFSRAAEQAKRKLHK